LLRTWIFLSDLTEKSGVLKTYVLLAPGVDYPVSTSQTSQTKNATVQKICLSIYPDTHAKKTN